MTEDNDDGDSATGDEVDDDGDGAMGDDDNDDDDGDSDGAMGSGATGYDDDDHSHRFIVWLSRSAVKLGYPNNIPKQNRA